jgi:hypothetical protein
VASIQTLKAQYQAVVVDSFKTGNQFLDLSKLLIWGTNSTQQSAFLTLQKEDKNGLKFSALGLQDSASKYGNFSNSNSLKTTTAIDYRIPAFNRTSDSMKIEFDAYWDTLISIGESGRIVLALLHDYPSGGPQFGDVDSVQKAAPFGRPAYNIRILNRRDPIGGITAGGYLFYGGGMDPHGEFEKTSDWWLPGFIAQPGGTSPQTGPAYPLGATVRIQSLLASSQDWTHFTFKIFPQWIEFWTRKTGESEAQNVLRSKMAIPNPASGLPFALSFLNQHYGTNLSALPFNYRWFPQIEAIRFYYRAVNKAYLSNIRISQSGNFSSENELLNQNKSGLYPNPVQGNTFWVKNEKVQKFQLFDRFGRFVENGTIQKGEGRLQSQAKGIYFLKLEAENGELAGSFTIKILN